MYFILETAKKDDLPVDYNALDYEENNDQSDKEDNQEAPTNQSKTEVPELIQYPPPGSFKPIETAAGGAECDDHSTNDNSTEKKSLEMEGNKENGAEKGENELVMNKRSEVLAMALGVEIKRGEDPATADASISGYEKKRRLQEKFANNLQQFEEVEENNTSNLHSKIEFGPRSEVFQKHTLENVNITKNQNQVNARREEHDFKRGPNRDKDKPDYDRKFRDRRPDMRTRGFDRNRQFNNYNRFVFLSVSFFVRINEFYLNVFFSI